MKVPVTVPLLAGFAVAWSGMATAQPLGTAFTYQGRLTDAGNPASGGFDFRFVLMDAESGGSQVGPTLTRDDVAVTSGLFTVSLDFGAVFAGSRRWLELATRPGASTGSYTTLGPRQELTPSPSASFSLSVPWSGVAGKPAGFADDVDDDSGGDITGVAAGTGLSGGGTTGAVSLSVNLGGSGSAATVSRSDHHHFAQGWTGDVSGPGLTVSNAAAVQNGTETVSGVRGVGLDGVLGESASSTGRGVVGRNSSSTGPAYGVYGHTSSPAGYAGFFQGSVGISSGAFPQGDLQIGAVTDSTAFRFGNSAARHHLVSNRDMVFNGFDPDRIPNGQPLFIWRRNFQQFEENSFATLMRLADNGELLVVGSVVGLSNASFAGTLSKGAGSFKIDHPLDPGNKYLYHSFVESPDMMNVYNGNATTDAEGYATVELPDWFEALNRDFRYQLTVVDPGDGWAMAKVVREVADNRFVLRTSAPRTRVSWQVTGIRHDPFAERHRIPVEQDKPEAERGRYLHPVEHGQPVERRID